MADPEKHHLTYAETATLLGVSRRTILRMTADGVLPVRRIQRASRRGTVPRIAKTDLDELRRVASNTDN